MELTVTVDRFEGDKAVLKTNDGEIIVWPKNKLPEDSREGMILNINVKTNVEARKKINESAKDILNEILNV